MALRILVVGGGLAGLATAVTLRKAGHKVQVFEASQLAFKDVVGPVVHLGPKSNELLVQWGLDATMARGILVRETAEFNLDGTMRAKGEQPQLPGWEYYDRSRLHMALLNLAVASTGLGNPVELSLGARVASADSDMAKVTLEDGRAFEGDVVVGADGFHSAIRQNLFDYDTVPSGPAKVAIHFSVDVTNLAQNAVVRRFQDEPGRYEKWVGADLEVLVQSITPASTLLVDFTIPVPSQTEQHITAQLLHKEIAKTFKFAHPDFLQLLAGVDTKDMHFWAQQSLPRVGKWTSKHLVLVGDAAHPFLPYELPGTAQTLNDAVALATELGLGIREHEIEGRLRAWETPRQDRVKAIQGIERASWSSM